MSANPDDEAKVTGHLQMALMNKTFGELGPWDGIQPISLAQRLLLIGWRSSAATNYVNHES